MIPAGQVAILTISLFGITLNIIVGSIVTFGLKLVSPDLVLICIISLTDMMLYLMNILRVIVTNTGLVIMDRDTFAPLPLWWCPFDSLITFIAVSSSIEIVAILSLMRYVKICLQKDVSKWIWYSLAICSLILSACLSLGNFHYGFYHWSFTDMFCVPVINPNEEGLQNKTYYLFYFSMYAIRFFISLVVITFCYIKVTTTYRGAIRSHMARSLEEQNKHQMESRIYLEAKESNEHMVHQREIEQFNQSIKNYKFKKASTTIKLVAATVGYIVCLLPDIILTILDLTIAPEYDVPPAILVNCLVMCSGIVSSFFVLLSHAQSKKYLMDIIRAIIGS